MYLDCDTTPSLRSRYVRAARHETAVRHAATLLREHDAEGQIGIYESAIGTGFKGYVIRYAGKEPYFEQAKEGDNGHDHHSADAED